MDEPSLRARNNRTGFVHRWPKENIIISVLKRAEENDGVIIRAYEAEGKKTAAVISFFGKSLKASFSPHEIKTLKFICGAGEAYETDILEEKLIGQKFTT